MASTQPYFFTANARTNQGSTVQYPKLNGQRPTLPSTPAPMSAAGPRSYGARNVDVASPSTVNLLDPQSAKGQSSVQATFARAPPNGLRSQASSNSLVRPPSLANLLQLAHRLFRTTILTLLPTRTSHRP